MASGSRQPRKRRLMPVNGKESVANSHSHFAPAGPWRPAGALFSSHGSRPVPPGRLARAPCPAELHPLERRCPRLHTSPQAGARWDQLTVKHPNLPSSPAPDERDGASRPALKQGGWVVANRRHQALDLTLQQPQRGICTARATRVLGDVASRGGSPGECHGEARASKETQDRVQPRPIPGALPFRARGAGTAPAAGGRQRRCPAALGRLKRRVLPDLDWAAPGLDTACPVGHGAHDQLIPL